MAKKEKKVRHDRKLREYYSRGEQGLNIGGVAKINSKSLQEFAWQFSVFSFSQYTYLYSLCFLCNHFWLMGDSSVFYGCFSRGSVPLPLSELTEKWTDSSSVAIQIELQNPEEFFCNFQHCFKILQHTYGPFAAHQCAMAHQWKIAENWSAWLT